MCWFDLYIYCEIIFTIRLDNTFTTSYNYLFLWWSFKIYSLGNFQVFSTVLLMLVNPELTHFVSRSSYPFDHLHPFPLAPVLHNHWYTLLVSPVILDFTYKWGHPVFVFPCVISMPSEFIYDVENGRIAFFLIIYIYFLYINIEDVIYIKDT